jgi:cytochrome c oxidase cbb3-type subunit III
MNKKVEDKLLDHEYDGIRELDNPLPGWWLATFYGAILFSILYVFHYHVGTGKTLEEETAIHLEEIRANAKIKAPTQTPTEESLLAAYKEPNSPKLGNEVYQNKCASCHMAKGEGSIGPNLADAYWIHGDGSLVEIAKVVADGVLDKGMPPWKAMLKPEEFNAVVGFVHSLKGTNPPNPKAPQGVEVKN